MALTNPSLFLYGITINALNCNIDFQAASMGPTLTAIVPIGYYSLTDFLAAIASAMNTTDTANVYAVTADRTIGGGTANRVSIATSGAFLSLLFNSGPNTNTSAAEQMGFNDADYTGETTYTGSATCGTILVPLYYGYNYVAPTRSKKVFGGVNISANGTKESITYPIQVFWEVEFRQEPASAVDEYWQPLNDWMIQQRPIDFTPDITNPDVVFSGTLESTEQDGTGLAYQMQEMLPDLPGLFQTGKMIFRQEPSVGQFQ